MKVVEINRKGNQDLTYLETIPTAVLTAVSETAKKYPNCQNDGANQNFPFDRLFEKLYNCRIEYHEDNVEVGRIIWDDDYDYTMFLLRWA